MPVVRKYIIVKATPKRKAHRRKVPTCTRGKSFHCGLTCLQAGAGKHCAALKRRA